MIKTVKIYKKDREKEPSRSPLEDAIRRSSFEALQPFGIGIEAILEIFGFGDETRPLVTRDEDIEGSANPELARQAGPVLAFLYSIADLNLDSEQNLYTTDYFVSLVSFVGRIHTDDAYEGLTKLLKRLVTENLNLKHLLLAQTVFSLARVSVALEREDSVALLKSAVYQLQDPGDNLGVLADYFDKLNGPDGIKAILTYHAAGKMPEVETQCLELLQKHDPDFVKEWNAQKAAANTEKAVKQKKS